MVLLVSLLLCCPAAATAALLRWQKAGSLEGKTGHNQQYRGEGEECATDQQHINLSSKVEELEVEVEVKVKRKLEISTKTFMNKSF